MTERPPLPHDPARVKEELQRRIRDVLDWVGIRDEVRGGVVTPLNPRRNDRKPGSFVIWTAGQSPGAWRDYAVDEKGDVWDLIIYLQGLERWIDAYWWALERLGWGRGVVRTKAQDLADRERYEADRRAREAKDEAARAVRASGLFKWWLTLPRIEGTVAWDYLNGARGIPMERLGGPVKSLRFCAERDHVDEDTGEVTSWPCMVAAMTRGSHVTALHFTWLAADGSGKAPVAPAKKMLGDARGVAVRLTPGPSGLTPNKAAKDGVRDTLMIGEGIETTLTAACARPDYRAWAAGTLGGMGRFDWPDCAAAVVLLRDNDWKPEALKAFDNVEAHWRKQAKGRAVHVAASARGSDFNDMIRGGA